MITRLFSPCSAGILATCLLLLPIFSVQSAAAPGENSFVVQLIWGTNGEKPKEKPLQEVDSKLLEKLRAVFKWKNYFEVDRKTLTVPKDGAQKLKLSDKCEIQVQDLTGSRIEVRLFGEGNLVVKKAQTVVPGEMIVLAGDGKDDTAWFVVLTPTR